ncbi:MAG: putative sulfate exporter family transporter [Candidatus Latescibacteria bacterium]|nr:putative sulfate exporter family transporter [Candidatus Latescibacterota bacterium]NIO55281.1 putative sulfate exporter family transporter [Candidatus Latescibacterota bacterium]
MNEGTESTAQKSRWSDLYLKEDWWAIWLAIGIILVALIFFFSGSTIKPIAAKPPFWEDTSTIKAHFADKWPWYIAQFAMWLVIFTISIRIMGLSVKKYIPGFLILYILAALIFVASSWKTMKDYNMEAPLVALLLGLIVGNMLKLPKWLDTSFRTEYYIKTGIILLGATLPLTIIVHAGPVAFLQATIVSVSTFLTIFLIGTYILKLDRRFSATMGAGGSVCGVSASIAVGGAVKAEKDHLAISISLVTIWAIVMIFVLPFVCKALRLNLGVAGAWIGTSEFADAAGFAAVQALSDTTDQAVRSFTLMKVIGRDIWIGLWSFALAIISVVYWERKGAVEKKVSPMEIWWRFPKFVLGFFAASIIISVISLRYTGAEFNDVLKPELIAPIKTLRSWTFVFTFLCIGFTTRFRELARFGWQPLAAFSLGVAVNVPLGYILSAIIFAKYWKGIAG